MKSYMLWISKSLLISGLCISGPMSGSAQEQSPETQPTGAALPAAERPDEAPGWMIVAKEAYWPLCFESLHRLEATDASVGASNDDELADSLETCAAWLNLSASAAMTDGRSGIQAAADLFNEAAEARRTGEKTWDDARVKELVTLGLVCTAKSHLLRADQADEDFRPERVSAASSKKQSEEVRALEKEIAKEKLAKLVAQYRYDASQSRRHMETAQTYLEAAANMGGFSLDKAVARRIPELASDLRVADLTEFVEVELRDRNQAMMTFVKAKQAELAKSLDQ